jgi:signal transduction histidine kinase
MNEQLPDVAQARLSALYEFSALLTGELEQSELLDRALAAMTRLSGAEGAVLALFAAPDGVLRPIAAHQADPEQGAAILAQVANSGEGLLLPGPAAAHLPGPGCLCAPLRARAQVIGAVYLEKAAASGVFVPADLALLQALADQTAVALHNFQLEEAVQTANKGKSDFVSLVTHELRLPLTAIKGYTDLIASGITGELNEQQKQFVAVIKRNLGRMSALISNLSDINRLESGRMQLDRKPCDIRDVLEDVAEALQEQLLARGQTLTVEIGEGETAVYADPNRLNQALSNLLSNAHHYTPDGGHITVQVRPGADFVVVAVEDDGLGISLENQARLFTPFFRAEDEAVREQPGWGLGLALTRLLIEAQGGEISFHSVYGQGSLFAFTVPSANIEVR